MDCKGENKKRTRNRELKKYSVGKPTKIAPTEKRGYRMICKNNQIKVSILIDLKQTTLSLFEMLGRIDQFKASPSYMDAEIYLDGSLNAIVAKEVLA